MFRNEFFSGQNTFYFISFLNIFVEFLPLPRSFLVFSINFSGSKIDSSSLSFIQSRIFPGSDEMNSFNAEQIVKIETAPSSISSSWSNKRIISRTSPFIWFQNKRLDQLEMVLISDRKTSKLVHFFGIFEKTLAIEQRTPRGCQLVAVHPYLVGVFRSVFEGVLNLVLAS